MAERPCPFCKGTGRYKDADAGAPRELRWTVATDSDETGSRVTLLGEVTEQANLEKLFTLPQPVVLDLAGVRYINTPGSLALVRMIEVLRNGVVAERCSPAVVRQLNLLPDLSDHLQVRSVILPFECPNCQVEYSALIDIENRRPLLLNRRCGTCFGVLEPDEPAEQYFAFLS